MTPERIAKIKALLDADALDSLTLNAPGIVSDMVRELCAEVERLRGELRFLDALHGAGVDNWDGYEDAQAILEDWGEEI